MHCVNKASCGTPIAHKLFHTRPASAPGKGEGERKDGFTPGEKRERGIQERAAMRPLDHWAHRLACNPAEIPTDFQAL